MNVTKIIILLLSSSVIGLYLSGCSSIENKPIRDIKGFIDNPDAVFLDCNGTDIKFLSSGMGSTNDYESYWTDVVIIDDKLIVPKFGEYKLRDSRANERMWWIVGANSYKDGYAELNSDTGKFRALVKNREFRANCKNKSQKLEID